MINDAPQLSEPNKPATGQRCVCTPTDRQRDESDRYLPSREAADTTMVLVAVGTASKLGGVHDCATPPPTRKAARRPGLAQRALGSRSTRTASNGAGFTNGKAEAPYGWPRSGERG